MGPRVPLNPPLAATPRFYFVVSSVAMGADGPVSLPWIAVPTWTCSAAASRRATERGRGHTAAAPTDALHTILSVLASRTPSRCTQFAGGISRLGRSRTTSARRAWTYRSRATQLEGPMLGLGRGRSPAGNSSWSNSAAVLVGDAGRPITFRPSRRTSQGHLSGASGLVSRVQVAPVARPARRAACTALMRRPVRRSLS